ncbi:MAG: HAD family hydrolase [Patescibacteria group bacterium]
MQKLAIFDIDGTIAVKGVLPESVVEGLRHIQELGFTTTVSTGRGYFRAKEALGKHFDTVIEPDSLMIVEHGTKIVDAKGNVVKADYFKENELDHIVDFTRANSHITRLLWFSSPDPKKKIQVWCQDEAEIAEETKKRGYYADVFHSTYEELRKRLSLEPVSNVSVKLKDYVVVENLKLRFTRSDIDTIFQDKMMEFVGNLADKAKAVEYLAQHYRASVGDTLVAGNAINDVDMLNLAAGKRILVGENENLGGIFQHLTNPEQVIQVSSPEELGHYLQKL